MSSDQRVESKTYSKELIDLVNDVVENSNSELIAKLKDFYSRTHLSQDEINKLYVGFLEIANNKYPAKIIESLKENYLNVINNSNPECSDYNSIKLIASYKDSIQNLQNSLDLLRNSFQDYFRLIKDNISFVIADEARSFSQDLNREIHSKRLLPVFADIVKFDGTQRIYISQMNALNDRFHVAGKLVKNATYLNLMKKKIPYNNPITRNLHEILAHVGEYAVAKHSNNPKVRDYPTLVLKSQAWSKQKSDKDTLLTFARIQSNRLGKKDYEVLVNAINSLYKKAAVHII